MHEEHWRTMKISSWTDSGNRNRVWTPPTMHWVKKKIKQNPLEFKTHRRKNAAESQRKQSYILVDVFSTCFIHVNTERWKIGRKTWKRNQIYDQLWKHQRHIALSQNWGYPKWLYFQTNSWFFKDLQALKLSSHNQDIQAPLDRARSCERA